jgi:hypothetical protein
METRTVLQSFKALYGAFEQFTKEGKHLMSGRYQHATFAGVGEGLRNVLLW